MKKYITVQTAKREIEQGFVLDSMIFGELMQFKDGNMDVDDLIHEINVQAIEEAKNSLEEVEPEEDVTPVIHAHWIEKHYVELKGTGLYAILGTCSNCKCEVITDESAEYCSNCGAVMDEEEPHEMCFDFEKTFHGAKMDEGVDDE